MFKSILVPTDGSHEANKAVASAADLAKKYDAKLILLNVMQDVSFEVPKELRKFPEFKRTEWVSQDVLVSYGKQIVRDAEMIAQEHEASDISTQVEVGDPASVILQVARTLDVNLIVMGSRGMGELKGLMLDSVSHKVSQLCECTCVIMK